MATLSPQLMATIKRIESGGNPNAQTGSYKGLYQLSDDEFRRFGGKGSIFDPSENARVAGLKLASEANQVEQRLGRPLTDAEMYMVHQQGTGGAYEHITNPNRPAWQSMLATGEGQSKGESWARKAIWGNVPDDVKAKYGSVDNMTSGQFMDMWRNKMGGSASAAPASPFPDVPAAVNGQIPVAAPPATTTAVPYANPAVGNGLTLTSNPADGWGGTVGTAGGTQMVTPQGAAPIVPGPVPDPAAAPASPGLLASLSGALSDKDGKPSDLSTGLDTMAKGMAPKITPAAMPQAPNLDVNQANQAAMQLMAAIASGKKNRGLTLTGM